MTSRDDWRRFTFGEIAENVTVRVDDPSRAGVERYVGLEHLDPESLTITRWGRPTDVEATKLRFWPGDVIFGRRRAYQRKLAVADFEGICSAHALVVRAKPEVVLPQFLPFFMSSDIFFERALAISVGSLSPTINWKTLREQEFDLPSIDEQRELADALWALQRVRSGWHKVGGKLSTARTRLFDRLVDSTDGAAVQLGDVLVSAQYGTSKRCADEPADEDVPVLRIPNVVSGRLELSDLKWGRFSSAEHELYSLELGDVLVVRTNGNPDYVGRGLAIDAAAPSHAVFASYLIRLRVDPERLDPRFLAVTLDAPAFRAGLRGSIRSSAGNYNLNATNIRRQRVRVPSLASQRKILQCVDRLDAGRALVERQTAETDSFRRSLIRDLLGPT